MDSNPTSTPANLENFTKPPTSQPANSKNVMKPPKLSHLLCNSYVTHQDNMNGFVWNK